MRRIVSLVRQIGQSIERAVNNKGARALLAHVRRSPQKTLPRWCDKHNLDRHMIADRLAGRATTMPLQLAVAIERATDGAVPAPWWLEADDESEPGAIGFTKIGRRGRGRAAGAA